MSKILFRLILSQFKIFFREPGVVFWSFGFPVMIAWVLGIAFANKGDTLHVVAVVDDSQNAMYSLPEWLLKKTDTDSTNYSNTSVIERQIVENKNEKISFRFKSMNEDEANMLLKRGQISLWLTGNPVQGIKYHFDPDNSQARLTFLLL